MTAARRHPGATGVAPWIDWDLTNQQRNHLREWFEGWKLERFDEEAVLDAIEASVRMYLQQKALAVQSSAKAVRRNLGNAMLASAKLLERMSQLDGNSHQIVLHLNQGSSLKQAVRSVHETLVKAHALALERFPARGRRPEHERDMLAALLADALETLTSIRPSARRGEIFEELLCEVFALVDETYSDLHTLAERVTQRQLVSRPSDGVTEILPYELAPKKSQ